MNMRILVPTWYKIAGAAKWILCRKVPRRQGWARLAVCVKCEVAQTRSALGILWLSCGEPGEDHGANGCGCVLGTATKKDTKRVLAIKDDKERRIMSLKVMSPTGKTRCRASCVRGLW